MRLYCTVALVLFATVSPGVSLPVPINFESQTFRRRGDAAELLARGAACSHPTNCEPPKPETPAYVSSKTQIPPRVLHYYQKSLEYQKDIDRMDKPTLIANLADSERDPDFIWIVIEHLTPEYRKELLREPNIPPRVSDALTASLEPNGSAAKSFHVFLTQTGLREAL
ncbi:hypothetical protein BC835DRAFT_1402657 [Cytidiella melzeri]|nr:hypothetical protein BC835DRAFT_1402657 [Cytidiella melzeri]